MFYTEKLVFCPWRTLHIKVLRLLITNKKSLFLEVEEIFTLSTFSICHIETETTIFRSLSVSINFKVSPQILYRI